MQSETTNSSEIETLAFKAHLAQTAVHHLEEIDGRTGTLLLKHRVLEQSPQPREDENVLSIVSDPNHQARMALPPGPVIAHFTDPENRTASCIPTPFLLLSQDKRARSAALEHFVRTMDLIAHPEPEKLKTALHGVRDPLLSDDLPIWTTSAIFLFDLINEDFFLNLAGFKQYLRLNYSDGLNEYFPKLLNPPLPGIEWVEPSVLTPTTQHLKITEIIGSCVTESGSFVEACDRFYRKLGTLPLHPSLSFPGVFEKWVASRGPVEAAFTAVWKWAERVASPLARYHAATLFACHPELVPPDGFEKLWNEILGATFGPNLQSPDAAGNQAWLLRIELAQHYLKFFAIQRPGRSEEAIACFAWWLAEQVSLAFVEHPHYVEIVRNSAVKVALRNSGLAWEAAVCPVEPCSLVYTTLWTPSVWSLSLASIVGKTFVNLGFSQLPREKQLQFETAAFASLCAWFPRRLSPSQVPTFAFDIGTDETCSQLAQAESDPKDGDNAKALLSRIKAVEENSVLLSAMRTILEADEQTRTLTLFAFRTRTYLNEISNEEVWELLKNQQWCIDLLLKLTDATLQVFCSTVNGLQLRGGDLWTCNIPHLFTSAAEAAHENQERQRFLLLFTILTSIRGSTTSAVDRLLHGPRRVDFAKDVDFWRQQFAKVMKLSPPWIAARIRPVMASLTLA